jgi:hypothetical protein
MEGLEIRISASFSAVDLQPNNGIVNTLSQRRPNGGHILDAAAFPVSALRNKEMAARARGKYWDFGINKTMDHADEIKIFTMGQTVGICIQIRTER